MSADSLETLTSKSKLKQSLEGRVALPASEESQFYLFTEVGSRRNSQHSVQSEPLCGKSKFKNDFIASTMTDYLNSHRHSIGSVMELLSNKNDDACYQNYDSVNKDFEHLEQIEDDMQLLEDEDIKGDPFFILSPIEEKSEPSTRSSSCKGSSGSGHAANKYFSFSCNALSKSYEDGETSYQKKYSSFPKTKNESFSSKDINYDSNMYPLEPREIDLESFHQLHTADSQEELQEFLLLESECMNERGRGLASAFSEEMDDYQSIEPTQTTDL
ncbi:uncharacterized protein LOC126740643 [Anthonomus grandis grandis]|uniref:uncharacterized protein LOC126740643 n=1 Tax=Anthonomus grandis grandis TaxID=2921223 RepID=UPI0021651994|nr:uncharacterized protein LOC126740643 [Anthonomus grandis grandis]